MDNDLARQVLETLKSSGKLSAVKLYLDATGAGLADSKAAVEEIERAGSLRQDVSDIAINASQRPAVDQVIELLERGQKLEAVKLYHNHMGVDLIEAKRAVEQIAVTLGLHKNVAAVPNKSGCFTTLLLVVTGFVVGASLVPAAFGQDWTQWRGPSGDGRSSATELPTTWSSTDKVAWKIPLPEPGNSTPIVYQDQVFLTQANAQSRSLICYSLKDGSQLWQASTDWSGPDPTHGTNPFCSASPVTDGERVVVWHGSAGLFCYDLNGQELWKRDLGIQQHIWGYGSSPVLHQGRCYLNFGPGERSFLIAIDAVTGETIWQHETPINREGTTEAPFQNADYYGSWSTPVVASLAGKEQLVLSLPFRLCGFDLETGTELWTAEGINALVYTSPLIQDDIVVAMGGYNGMSIAVNIDEQGKSKRLWRHAQTPQRIGSGAIHNGHLFIHNDPGIAECLNLETGETVWKERLSGPGGKGTNWSSVMLADGLCYTINQSGDCFVFRADSEFELLSVNSLGETSNSSMVPAAGGLLIRTHQHLWYIR
jgi:outer membrane protein assembly factor BamB/ribosomal protein L7/L12